MVAQHYPAHVAERQKKLDAARKRLAEDQAELAALEAEG